MNWVWTQSPTSGNERLVLLALADACSRDDGTGCWPSVPTIARKANISERTAWRVISRLEAAGHLKVTRQGGGSQRSTNAYAVIMHGAKTTVPAHDDPCQDDTPVGSGRVTDQHPSPLTGRHPSGVTGVTPGVSLVTPDPPGNLKHPPEGRAAPATGDSGDGEDHAGTTTARRLIAAYAGRCPTRPPSAVLGQLGRQAAAMLAEGIDPAAVARALGRFSERPMHPSVLPSLVNEELNPPRAAPRRAQPADVAVGAAVAVPDADPDDPAAYIAALRGGSYRTTTTHEGQE